jgi:hypothetical protein
MAKAHKPPKIGPYTRTMLASIWTKWGGFRPAAPSLLPQHVEGAAFHTVALMDHQSDAYRKPTVPKLTVQMFPRNLSVLFHSLQICGQALLKSRLWLSQHITLHLGAPDLTNVQHSLLFGRYLMHTLAATWLGTWLRSCMTCILHTRYVLIHSFALLKLSMSTDWPGYT